MEKELRTVGITGMDKTPWGTHFCQFYQTKAGLIDLLVPYFKAAIEKHKMVMVCTYAMESCGATAVTDVVRIHQHSLMERLCMWERVESAELKRTRAELRKLTDHLEALIDKRSIQFNATIEELRNEIATLKRADEELSPRQREVLQLVAKGRSIKEIAGALKISPKTVEFHKSQIMKQLDLRTTAELTKYAITLGLVSL